MSLIRQRTLSFNKDILSCFLFVLFHKRDSIITIAYGLIRHFPIVYVTIQLRYYADFEIHCVTRVLLTCVYGEMHRLNKSFQLHIIQHFKLHIIQMFCFRL